jgi:glutathione-specific gamma-glutamylcyclotransferase
MARKLRQLSLTAELVALVDRKEPDSGPEYGQVEMTDEEYEHAAHDFLRRKSDKPFWVFAYGSLVWRPDFEHIEHRTCRAFGWRRSFCLDIVRWRATPQQPGLMMCMDYGGSCHGVAFRLPDGNDREQMLRLLRREASYKEDLPSFRWIDVHDGKQKFRALTFWAAPRSPGYYINLPIEEQAQRLARAAGHLGTSAEYLHNTIVKLEEFGIHDSYLWRLQKLVADEIRRMHG